MVMAVSPYSRGLVAALLDAWPELTEGWHPGRSGGGYHGHHSQAASWEIGAVYKADMERAVKLLAPEIRMLVFRRFALRRRVACSLSFLVDAVWRGMN